MDQNTSVLGVGNVGLQVGDRVSVDYRKKDDDGENPYDAVVITLQQLPEPKPDPDSGSDSSSSEPDTPSSEPDSAASSNSSPT